MGIKKSQVVCGSSTVHTEEAIGPGYCKSEEDRTSGGRGGGERERGRQLAPL